MQREAKDIDIFIHVPKSGDPAYHHGFLQGMLWSYDWKPWVIADVDYLREEEKPSDKDFKFDAEVAESGKDKYEDSCDAGGEDYEVSGMEGLECVFSTQVYGKDVQVITLNQEEFDSGVERFSTSICKIKWHPDTGYEVDKEFDISLNHSVIFKSLVTEEDSYHYRKMVDKFTQLGFKEVPREKASEISGIKLEV
jgi:hypothetical protein